MYIYINYYKNQTLNKMNDKLKELLQSPSLPSIRLGWVMGKGMGVGVEGMARVVMERCEIIETGLLEIEILMGRNIKSLIFTRGSFDMDLYCKGSVRAPLIDDGDLYDVWCDLICRNPTQMAKYRMKRLVRQSIIKHFENE